MVTGRFEVKNGVRGEEVVFKKPVPDPKYPQLFPARPTGRINYPYSCLYLSDSRQAIPVEGNWCKVLDTKPGDRVEVDALLEPASQFQVLMCDEAGKHLTRTRVSGPRSLDMFAPYANPTDTCTVYDLQPGKSRVLVFFHPGRKLAAKLTLRGDETGGATVTLRPTGTVKGRLVGEDGKPLVGVPVDLAYFNSTAAKLHEDAEWHKTLFSGPDGSFLIHGVFPGLEFDLTLSRVGRQRMLAPSLVSPVKDLKLESGETRDLSTLTVKPTGKASED